MTAPHSRLSVVTIVRDAAEALRLTLASVRDIADEIVVVDTGSTDRSREVAKEFGACIAEFPWTDDFSAARNFAAQRAQGDWLLSLDAGETLSDADAGNLKEFTNRQADPSQAYLLVVRVPPYDAGSSPEQIARVRLLPRNPKILWSGRVWESPVESLTSLHLKLVGLPYVIRRGDREFDARIKKHRAHRNLRIAELELRESGDHARLWNCLGDALQTLGDGGKSADCFRRSLTCAKPGSQEMLEAHYGLLTSLGATAAEQEEQLRLCIHALETFPTDAQLLCALGGYLQARGNLPLAGQAYLTGFNFGQVIPTSWHVAEIRDVAAVCHSLILQLLQQPEAARRFLENALADHSKSVRLRRRLIDLLIEQGDRDGALAHVSLLPQETPHLEALRSAVRGACFAVQQNLIAAKAYLRAAHTHGCRDPLCLKWLSLCLLAVGEATAARPILLEWQTLQPRNPEVDTLLAKLESMAAPAATASPVATTKNLRIDSPGNMAGGNTQPIKLNLPAWSPTANPGT